MSSVIQTQSLLQVAATLANAAETVVNVPRPQTSPAQPAYAEGSDHVIAPSFLREEEGGRVIIDLPTAFVAGTVFLRRVSIMKLLPTAQKGVAGPSDAYFPTGAPTDSTFVRDLVNTGTGNTLATNADTVRDLFGNLRATPASVPSMPGITLEAGEFVRLTFFQSTGAPIGPGTINAMYKMGRNQKEVGATGLGA